jgi:hypothetical protein
MTIKTLLVATTFLAISALISNCKKEEQPTTSATKIENAQVKERVNCDVNIQVSSAVTVCGVQNTKDLCSTVGFLNLYGRDLIPTGGNATYSIEAPTIIQITPEPAFASSIDATYDVFVTTSTGVKQFTFLLVGGPQNININQFCDPS